MERTLIWFLIAAVLATVCIHAYLYGAIAYIYESDLTKLSVVISGILVYKTLTAGVMTYRAEKSAQGRETSWHHNHAINSLDKEDEALSFWRNISVALGLIGTFIGIVYMGYMLTVTLNAPEYSPDDAAKILVPSFGIALMTSLLGQVTNVILNIQQRNLAVLKVQIEEMRGGEGYVSAQE